MLIEIALIKLTKPQMEQNLDSILQRLNELEERLDETPVMTEAMMQQMSARMSAQMNVQMAEMANGNPGNSMVGAQAGAGAEISGLSDNPVAGGNGMQMISQPALIAPEQVAIPKAQLEDLNLIRQEWGRLSASSAERSDRVFATRFLSRVERTVFASSFRFATITRLEADRRFSVSLKSM